MKESTEVLEKSKSKINNLIKVCCLSDLHGNLPEINPCDLVLICGDQVDLYAQGSSNSTRRWYLTEFKPWAESLPCQKVLFIAGNHELHFRKDMLWVKENFNSSQKVTYLEDTSYIFTTKDGKSITIYGTPYCKVFGRWAFMYQDEILRELYSNIPKGTDILMTHDAPYGCSDILLEPTCWSDGSHIGNVPLREAIIEKHPTIVVHGHLHSTNHNEEILETTRVYNVSILSETYEVIYDPLYLDI